VGVWGGGGRGGGGVFVVFGGFCVVEGMGFSGPGWVLDEGLGVCFRSGERFDVWVGGGGVGRRGLGGRGFSGVGGFGLGGVVGRIHSQPLFLWGSFPPPRDSLNTNMNRKGNLVQVF